MNAAEKIFEAVRDLPEPDALEVLDFVAALKTRRAQAQAGEGLLSFAGSLRNTPNFTGDLVEWQRNQRDEWR